jgi:hypothetical protein
MREESLKPASAGFLLGLLFDSNSEVIVSKSKAIPVTGSEGPWGCERSRLPHLLDNRLIDGGKVVSLTRRPRFTPQESSWYSFLLEAGSTTGPQCGWKD